MFGKPDYDPIIDAHRCEECGRWYRALARHITRHHKITTREYKIKWGINLKEPLIGESVRAKLKEAVYNKGTYKNLELGYAYRFKKGERTFQNYRRSEQTKRRLRLLVKMTKSKRIRLRKKHT
jgi:hypothetical protein